jgi:hypothetical protein
VRPIAAAVVLVALDAVACGGSDTAPLATDVGVAPRVFRQDPSPTLEGEGALVHGTLGYDVEHGCFVVESEGIAYPVVWPAETEGVADGPGVELPDGLVIRMGDDVSGGGGFHQAGDGDVARFDIPAHCVPSTGEVALFNANGRVTTRLGEG